jgi:hypothetical protein
LACGEMSRFFSFIYFACSEPVHVLLYLDNGVAWIAPRTSAEYLWGFAQALSYLHKYSRGVYSFKTLTFCSYAAAGIYKPKCNSFMTDLYESIFPSLHIIQSIRFCQNQMVAKFD